MAVKLIVVAALVAAGIVGVVSARPAQGDPGQTLRFVAAPPLTGDQKQIDVPPQGLSLGDESIGALSLRHNGQLFGRALVDCTINDKTYQGQQCTLDLVLRDGLITAKTAGLDRLLPHQSGVTQRCLRGDRRHRSLHGGERRRHDPPRRAGGRPCRPADVGESLGGIGQWRSAVSTLPGWVCVG